MPKWLKALLLLYIPIMGAAVAWYYSDAQVTRRIFNATNDTMNTITAAKDVPALTQFLGTLLEDTASVDIRVEHAMLGIKTDSVIMKQVFSKEEFINFVQLTLDPMESYALTTRIDDITENTDGSYTLTSFASGNGKANEMMKGARIPTLYNVQMNCETHATLLEKTARVREMKCEIGLAQQADANSPIDIQDIMNRARGVTP